MVFSAGYLVDLHFHFGHYWAMVKKEEGVASCILKHSFPECSTLN